MRLLSKVMPAVRVQARLRVSDWLKKRSRGDETMKRYLFGAALSGVLLCAPVMAQDASQTVEAVAQEPVVTDAAPIAAPAVAPVAEPHELPLISAPVAGYTYFHRAGATMAEQQADLAACRPSVLAMVYSEPGSDAVVSGSGASTYTPVYMPPSVSPGAAAGAGVIALLAVAVAVETERRMAARRDMHLNYETCMVARGWSVVELDEETGRPLDRMGASRLTAALTPMVGAPTPVGTVRRQFNNDYRFASPEEVGEMSLSLQTLDDEYFGERQGSNNMLARNSREDHRRERERLERANARTEARRALMAGRPGKGASPVDVTAIGDLPEGSALIAIASRGPSVRLVNVGAQTGEQADALLATALDGVQFFAVPAGDWRLTSLSTSAPATSLCLGAPSFNAAAGEVVYAGAFGVDGQPDLALDGVREQLAARPDLAERVRAASYRNGVTFDCGGASFLAAFHINGAPFEEGYTGARMVTAAE